ncbi:MAG TPA: VWA domain-containing protein [Blastocatellia bacterium]|nr:VWA domain-containing protein [Blastocatellia bacterium]
MKSSGRLPNAIWISVALALLLCAAPSLSQSGKGTPGGRRILSLNVIVHAPEGRLVTRDDLDLYDAGVSQEIDSFTKLDSGSRIVLAVDSSENLKAEPGLLQKAAHSIVNELYQDDQMMIVGFNETAEIVEDTTGDLAKLQVASGKFARKGSPNLFDALVAIADSLSSQATLGLEKKVIILVSDGYDSESKSKFDDAIRALQEGNIVLYAIQVPDRTHGALMRDKPKPPAALAQLSGATGGAVYPFEKAEEAAKTLVDDLRKNWYKLVYSPSGITTMTARRLLLISRDPKVEVRTKGAQPSRFRQSS